MSDREKTGEQTVDVKAVLQAAFASGKLLSLTDHPVALGIGRQTQPQRPSAWPTPGRICEPSLF